MATLRERQGRGMPASPDPFSCELFFAATHGDGARETVALRRAERRGELTRVHQGTYARTDDLDVLDDRGRHVVLARAVTLGLSGGCVLSHRSAALVHDLPRVARPVPDVVTVLDPRRTTTTRSTHLLRRPGEVPAAEVGCVRGLVVTGLVRTALDIARTVSWADAVLALDATLRRLVLADRHDAGPDIGSRLDEVRATLLERVGDGSRPGDRTARRAVLFASPWAENGGESLLRLGLFDLGVSGVELQRSIWSGGRFVGRCDAFLPEWGVAVEFDGHVKLTDQRMLAGRSPADVVRDRVRRDRRLLESDEVAHVVHCEYADVVEPRGLAELLRGAGVALDPRRVAAASRAAARRFTGVPR